MKGIHLNMQGKQMLAGNILLICCCACYLIWWLVTFFPESRLEKFSTGWILVPALACGLASILLIFRSIVKTEISHVLIPKDLIIWGGVIAYVVLILITRLLFSRPLTMELLLIVGWGMLMLSEINTLYGVGIFTRRQSICFCLVMAAAVAVSLICYTLYYGLNGIPAYIDGIVPLVLAAAVTAAVCGGMLKEIRIQNSNMQQNTCDVKKTTEKDI